MKNLNLALQSRGLNVLHNYGEFGLGVVLASLPNNKLKVYFPEDQANASYKGKHDKRVKILKTSSVTFLK